MIEIKLLSDCPLKDAQKAWNEGFSDYYVNIQMSLNQFTFRLGSDEISPDFSLIAYFNGDPIGILLNGIKRLNGQKWAWNGGTSVAPSYRGQEVATKLMRATLDLYKRLEVDIATLEAFSINEKAIKLYENFGYRVMDRLLFLENKKGMDLGYFNVKGKDQYLIQHGIPQDVRDISFYNKLVPWKTQWNFIRDGESIIVRNHSSDVVGYALFQRKFDDEGKVSTIILYQCSVDESQQYQRNIIKLILANVFTEGASLTLNRTTYNLPSKNKHLVNILKEAGFKESFTKNAIPLEQVFMTNNIR